MWEDRVFNDPDGVEVDDLFDDLYSDDERTQYEAVVGVYWLAQARPDRVRPRADELLELFGHLPDFSLGDDGGSGTRRWFADGIAELVMAYPEQFLSPILIQLASDDETVREDAARVFRITANKTTSPEVLQQLLKHRSEFTDCLDDPNETVRTNSLWTLAGIADTYPKAVVDLVPRVVSLLDPTSPNIAGVAFVQYVATESPELVEPAVGPLVDAVGRVNTDDIPESRVVLQALLALAETYPEQINRAKHDVAQLADAGPEPVSRPATELLDVLTSSSCSYS